MCAAALCLPIFLAAAPAQAGQRIVALDQCADQYVMALVPRSEIAGVTPRADDDDAWLRTRAAGLPVRRPTAESMLAAGPTVAVRYWGGDERLMRALQRRGVRVVQIDDATDFDGVRANVRRVAAGVGQPAAGERLVARMDADLAGARGAWGGGCIGFAAGRQQQRRRQTTHSQAPTHTRGGQNSGGKGSRLGRLGRLGIAQGRHGFPSVRERCSGRKTSLGRLAGCHAPHCNEMKWSIAVYIHT